MQLIFRILNGLQQIVEAGDAATVLGRSVSFTGQAEGVSASCVSTI